MRRRLRWVAFAVIATSVSLVHAGGALAQTPGQVTGLAAVQEEGFVTLSWEPVERATDYQVERTPVDGADQPMGPATIVGLWQPTRTVRPDAPTFAEAGFVLGERFCWRVRARFGTEAQAFSEAVCGTTLPQWGVGPGASLRTQFEQTNGASYTSDVNEYLYTAALDAASERVRVVEIGRTLLGRPINMFVFGYPKPLSSAAEISWSTATLIQCNVHGDEPSMRESCLILARELAFTDDKTLLRIMRRSTVLIVPTLNGDGRAADTRGSSTGQDLNRDHSLLREPETKAFSAMLRDYTPDVAVDGHNGDNEDLPVLGPRHLNVYEALHSEAKNGLIESWIYDNAALAGWYAGPYRTAVPVRRPSSATRSASRASSGSCPRTAAGPESHGRARPSRATRTARATASSGWSSSCSTTTTRTIPRSGAWSRTRARSSGPTSAGSFSAARTRGRRSRRCRAHRTSTLRSRPRYSRIRRAATSSPRSSTRRRCRRGAWSCGSACTGSRSSPRPTTSCASSAPATSSEWPSRYAGSSRRCSTSRRPSRWSEARACRRARRGAALQVVPVPFQAAIWSAGSNDYVSD